MIRAGLREAIYAGEVPWASRRGRWRGGAYDVANWRCRADAVRDLPGAIARRVLLQADAYDERDELPAGTRAVLRDTQALTDAHVHDAFDEQRIREFAENHSRLCGRILTLERREEFVRWLGIEPPAGADMTREGRMLRLADPVWWRRQLRKRWTREAEGGLRNLGMIRRGEQPYASDLAVQHRAAGKRKAREFLERSVLINEDGEQLELLQVAEKSIANPRIRRGEFMCRVRGFEEIAGDLGHVAEFVTLTCPSAFHAQLAAAGQNPAYIRATVREAQQWLCRMWARARAKLKRLSILIYGFRIAEPHHDATPHWHLLLFVRDRDAEQLRTVLRLVWLAEFSAEPGAREHRAKFERIDASKGSAVGYVAKYVSKNIDGAGAIGDDTDGETGARVSEGVQRVDAWASVHGIRQFQQIGGPPVGLWREARRLRDQHLDADLERARLFADRGNWRGFVQAVGGIHAGRRTNIRLEKVETGEKNRYGEHRAARIVGLRCASAVAISRPHTWRIEQCTGTAGTSSCGTMGRGGFSSGTGSRSSTTGSMDSDSPIFSALGPVAITVRGASSAGEPDGWTDPRETSRAGPP